MATDYELTFYDYLSIVRRRAPYLIGIFIAVLLISVVVAITIPTTYRATGTIMVESQQVPDNIVPNAIKNQLEERLSIIKQRVMTRDNLVQIANKYNLFKEKLDPMAPTELIDRIRDRIVVETSGSKEATHSYRQERQAIAFTLSFEDRRPEVALNVTNDLIALFLDWNVKLRTGEATDTTAFLAQESDKLKSDVSRMEKLISAYKQQYGSALPEQMTLRMNMLSRAESDLREVERDIRSTREGIRTMEVELTGVNHGLGENSFQTLPALKAELVRLSTIYNESHPDIRRIKHKIEMMEKTTDMPASDIASTEAAGNTLNPARYRIQSRIDSDRARLASLEQQRDMLQRKINNNEDAMTKTPKVEQGLDVLIRDRDSAQRKYEELLNKLMNAKIAESLESGNKTGRFSVLEAPQLPEKPFKPDRIKILIMGFFLALASSGGAMMILESIDKRIRGIDAITHVLGYRPMVVIPYIAIHEDEVRRKRMLKMIIISVVVTMIIFALLLHFL